MSAHIAYITEHSKHSCPQYNGHRMCGKSKILFQVRGNFYLLYANDCLLPENADSVEPFINSILKQSGIKTKTHNNYHRTVNHKFTEQKTLDKKSDFILKEKLKEVHFIYSGGGNGHHYYLTSEQTALNVIDYQKNLFESCKEMVELIKNGCGDSDLIKQAEELRLLNIITVSEKEILHTVDSVIKQINKHESKIK